jgi:hypothetical protein
MNEWIINDDNNNDINDFFNLFIFFNFLIFFKIIHKKVWPCFDYKPYMEVNLLK